MVKKGRHSIEANGSEKLLIVYSSVRLFEYRVPFVRNLSQLMV
jgi:hypothetical protein